jgi:hypothetical protein
LLHATTTSEYDRQDRLAAQTALQVVLGAGVTRDLTTRYTYDALGNLLQVDQPGENCSCSQN